MTDPFLVYIGEKPFYIASEITAALRPLTHRANTIVINHPTEADISRSVQHLEQGPAETVLILTQHTAHYEKVFRGLFKEIKAGGGAVLNETGALLWIYRRGKWDLPKGKQDDGESLEACALREVQEETGLQQVITTGFLGYTYHTYKEKGKNILKTTAWYRMLAPGTQPLIPQTEEDIEQLCWRMPDTWQEPLADTYPSIRLIVAQLPALK